MTLDVRPPEPPIDADVARAPTAQASTVAAIRKATGGIARHAAVEASS